MVHGSSRIIGPGRLIVLVILPGLLLAALSYRAASVRDSRALDDAFRVDSTQRVHSLAQETTHYLEAVDSVRALFASSSEVTRPEFETFCRTVLPQGKAAIGIAWCPRVRQPELAKHEAQAHAQGFADYRVRDVGPSGSLVPAAARPEYFPVTYVAPESRLAWQGFDLLAEPVLRVGIEEARDTGRRTVTRGVTSPRFPEHRKMVIVVSPYYGSAAMPPTVEERQRRLVGVVVFALDVASLLEEGIEQPKIPGIDVYLFDVTDPKEADLLTERISGHRDQLDHQPPTWPREKSNRRTRWIPYDPGNRSWAFCCVPTDRYLAEHRGWIPMAALIAFTSVTAVVGWYVNSLRGKAVEVERLVETRTLELSEANEHLRTEVATRRRAERLLEEERNHLREMLENQENDRRIIAYEIHDGFVQKSVGSLMLLQSMAAQMHEAPARETLATATELVSESIAEARQLIGGLRPQELEEQGVVAALESLAEVSRRRWSVDVELSAQAQFHRLPAPLETAIYRIAQESLTNAVKHSGSPRVRIALAESEGRVSIEVRDWGRGFDPAAVPPNHHGLEGIRERTRLFGGTLDVRSRPGEGTCIRVELPLSAKGEEPPTAEEPPQPV